MIFDSLSNFKMYLSIHPYFKDAYDFLSRSDLKEITPGRYNLNNGMFANVDEYATKDISEGFIEFHRKYIDIQIILKGVEKIGVCGKESAHELEFNEEKDFGKLKGKTDFITLKENDFVIFFSHDGHMPQIMEGSNKQSVKKIVIKVPVI